MGSLTLVYSPIQLNMENLYLIFPIARLENVEVDLRGFKTTTYFEVIEIMGEMDPYPTLIEIEWAYENYGIIDLKNKTMTFEAYGMKVMQPLYMHQCPWYTDRVQENMEPCVLDDI